MKKDDNGQDLAFEKVADLYPGMSVWKVSVEKCREQDKNAQVMDKATFDRLKANVESDKRLESLPLGYIAPNPAGNKEFFIISGHHRIRAARMANITEIFVLVIEEELNQDQIRSKQLAHNAITGDSDTQMLKELYDSIEDLQQKIASGVREIDLGKEKFKGVTLETISLDFDYRCVKIMFLSSQAKNLEAVVKEIDKEDLVLIADNATFDQFAETLREMSKNEGIRNVASILSRMCEIVMDHCKATEKEQKEAPKRRKIGFGDGDTE